jgi:hypothetical protein
LPAKLVQHAPTRAPLAEWDAVLTGEWDLARVESILSTEPLLRRLADEFQNPFKSSWYFDNASATPSISSRR